MPTDYRYDASLERVIDGDTVMLAWIDLPDENIPAPWCKTIARRASHVRLRFAGINAPEKTTPQGVVAGNALGSMLEAAGYLGIVTKTCTVSTAWTFDDRGGRLIGDLILQDGTNVSQWMVNKGYAVVHNYKLYAPED